MSSLVDELILAHKGMFEDDRNYAIRRHYVYGMTVKRKLYAMAELRFFSNVASFSLLWYDAEKSEFHEPKHGKRKKREIVLWKREAH